MLTTRCLPRLPAPPLLSVQAESQAIRVQNGQLDAETMKVGGWVGLWLCVVAFLVPG